MEAASEPNALELHITGMDCANCALTLERGITRLADVESCEVSFSTGKMRVVGTADMDVVETRISALGYSVASPAEVASTKTDIQRSSFWGLVDFMLSRRNTTLALVGAALLIVSAIASLMSLPEPLLVGLHLFIIVLAGTPIMLSGWRNLILSRDITIDLLMSIATIGAVIIGESAEGATVVVLFAIGESLEGYSAERARYSLQALMNLVPQEATVLRPCLDCAEHLGQDGYTGGPCPFCGLHETRLPVEALQIDDVVLVPPGERIPMDGQVRAGESAVNQAPITGESIPVNKISGDEVFAGAINGEGALEITVTSLAADNTLSRIIQLVEEAQSQRAPTQRQIDRFARWYTPGVVLLAMLIAIVPPVLFGAPFLNPADGSVGWLYRALALLIVACPCALVISTPVTIVSALSSAARRGVLIKGGAPLETLARVRAFAFDKTGTLTKGQPTLTHYRAVDCEASDPNAPCEPCNDLLALAAAVERRSEHPLAHAIVDAAETHHLLERYAPATGVASLAGRGVQGNVNGRTVTLGSHALFDAEYPHSKSLCQEVNVLQQQGQTAMLLADADQVRGVLTVADSPRAASQTALAALKTLRPTPKTIMLTGDHQAVAEAIGAEVGVDEVRANLLPAQKLAAIRDLETQHGAVAMVGDGINDAPALAAASVGIAMGGIGTAQAMETADIVLMQDDLSHLPDTVKLSRDTLGIIRQNVIFSLAIKGLFLLLTIPGWATLWLAVFADVGTSLLVTANGMRLLRRK